ncbi:hypothetical protein Ae505Ps2_6074 [Pseudonocardia sp. Ae505_Ps2]|nr:hypothetical protein Ae505Ps2_6050 [Pseudonocardia sp. Ae505_Ps2]OLM08687.1 hypothetical protein Ae505Ps2_6074 [Pseudonocardia sp. Ae505_Ps2]
MDGTTPPSVRPPRTGLSTPGGQLRLRAEPRPAAPELPGREVREDLVGEREVPAHPGLDHQPRLGRLRRALPGDPLRQVGVPHRAHTHAPSSSAYRPSIAAFTDGSRATTSSYRIRSASHTAWIRATAASVSSSADGPSAVTARRPSTAGSRPASPTAGQPAAAGAPPRAHPSADAAAGAAPRGTPAPRRWGSRPRPRVRTGAATAAPSAAATPGPARRRRGGAACSAGEASGPRPRSWLSE